MHYLPASDILQQDVGRNLDSNIREIEDCESPIEAIANQVELLGHSFDASISIRRIRYIQLLDQQHIYPILALWRNLLVLVFV